jgi:hypothetical protein
MAKFRVNSTSRPAYDAQTGNSRPRGLPCPILAFMRGIEHGCPESQLWHLLGVIALVIISRSAEHQLNQAQIAVKT